MTCVFQRIVIGIFTIFLCACDSGTAQNPGQLPELVEKDPTNPGYQEKPDWFKQSFLDIREDIQEASDQSRRVLLYFYQDGCPYCKKLLDVNFSQQNITDKTKKYFDVIAINIWGDREVYDLKGKTTSEKKFAAAFNVMFTPTMLFLDEDGQVVTRLNGYYPPQNFEAVIDYAGQHQKKETSFRNYWAKHAPPATSGVLHHQDSFIQPPYKLSALNKKQALLVMFEQKECLHCDELHLDILKRRESLELLEQFDVVLLDIWADTALQTPAGIDTTAAKWAEELKVQYTPSLVMFDAGGKEVFRTEGYLKAFHTQSALDYVLSSAYLKQPNFQRFIQSRAEALEAQGIHVDLMK